jgi:hypothetical protein
LEVFLLGCKRGYFLELSWGVFNHEKYEKHEMARIWSRGTIHGSRFFSPRRVEEEEGIRD